MHTLTLFLHAVYASVFFCLVQFSQCGLRHDSIALFGFVPIFVANDTKEAYTSLEWGYIL